MITCDYHSTTPINRRADHSNSELMTLISQQILVGNYTNYCLLLDLLQLPAIKQPDPLDAEIQESINKIKASCEPQETEQTCQHALTLIGTLFLFGIGSPQKEYAKAISCFEKAMAFNNSYALNNRGYMYHLGLGDSKNCDEAIRLYQQAIELGNSLAMNNLAFLYEKKGGADNIAKAIPLYQQAIKLGDPSAMNNLAFLYKQQGGTDNIDKAIALYQEASQLGDPSAMNNLAMFYKQRDGADNIAKAIALHQQASELGNLAAMYNLAFLHNEQGGADNIAKAIALYEKAIRLGHAPDALHNLTALYHHNNTTTNQKQIMQHLLPLIWKDLLAGVMFTEKTLSALGSNCQQEIIERLKAAPEGTSLAFLNQLKRKPHHPLTLIINYKQSGLEDKFKSLMMEARNLLRTRWAFFRAVPINEQDCPLNHLPPEMKYHLFSFVQPGIEKDREQNYFLSAMNNT